MLDSKLNNIRFETISSKYYDDVIEHLRQTFFADEPLNKAVHLTRPGQGHPLLEQHSLSTLKDNVSIMAISNDGDVRMVYDISIKLKLCSNYCHSRSPV